MRVLVISQYYYPEQFRVTDICEALVQRGHHVTVICAPPNYPEGEIFSGYKDKRKEIVNGVRVYRVNSRPRHKGKVNLALNYLSYMIKASALVKRIRSKFDIIFAYEVSPIFIGIPAIVAKKKLQVPSLLYCLDLWPDAVKGIIGSESSPQYQLIKLISTMIYNKMDVVLAKSASFKTYLERICSVPSKKIKILPEHAEDTYLSIEPTPIQNGIVDFMFLGNIGSAQDCDVIVKATALIDQALPFKVHFVGDGSMLDEIKRMVQENNLEQKVIFHGRHPLNEMPNYYSLADVCILTLSDKDATGLTVPAKLTGYMAASRPVIGAISGDATDIISQSKCGYCVSSGDYSGLAELMKQCIEEKEKLTNLGTNGRKYFLQNYTKEIFAQRLETIFKNIFL